MSETATLNIAIQAADQLIASVVASGATRTRITYSMPASATAQEVDVVLTRSAVQLLYITADVNFTLKTNSSSAPDDTITVTAGIPILVGLAGNVPNGTKTAATFFSADITKLFIVNTSSPLATGTFELLAIIT